MAFQAGTQIDPRLAIADYSGFARAGEIEGAGMAQMGQTISQGIKGYKEKKKQEKVDQAKINRSIAFGESMIGMLGEDNELSNVIADQLAMNFGADVPFEQKVAASDGLQQEITNMFLLQQKAQPPTFTPGPGGGMIMQQGGDTKFYTPYSMGVGSSTSGVDNIIAALDAADKRIAELEGQQ
jgi:hypothetical protein